MYKMTVDFPNLAKGAEVQIDGLGIFENGFEHTIDAELAQSYRDHHTTIVEDFDADGTIVGRHTEQGPTLLQAFQNHNGITIASSKTKDKKDPEGGAS